MRITDLTVLRASGGWRPFSFLKISTDEGLVGWSEFLEGPWSPALADVILQLGQAVRGSDPRAWAVRAAELTAMTRFTAGGLSRQAVSAIENACVDIAAKAAGVPACALVGGPFRDQVDVYWSHCGTFRVRHPDLFQRVMGRPALTSLDDLRELGREAAQRGFSAVKINPVLFDAGVPRLLNPGFAIAALDHAGAPDLRTLDAIVAQVAAVREGLGAGRGLMLDVNFAFKPAALRRLARALADISPGWTPHWLELDVPDAAALASIRNSSDVPIASLESVYGRAGYLPYLTAQAVDVAVVDVLWNGFGEAVRIAALADTHQVNVAPHNFQGPLADLIAAHYCAAIPNAAIMEYEGDDVPWKHALIDLPSPLADGRFTVPDKPGWGADVNEDAVREYPWSTSRG